ncbi:MAG: transporter [Chthoniobacterales bacterium]
MTRRARIGDRIRQHDLAGDRRHEAIGEQRKPGFVARLGTAFSVVVLASAGAARAQDLEPRAYVDTPVGLNFLVAGYAYSEGGVSTDASLPIQGAQLTQNNFFLAYARSLNVFGQCGKIDIILSFSQLSGSALVAGHPMEREVTGSTDPRFRFSVNFYGAPALSMEDYQSYRQNIIAGASIQVTVPASQYDSSKLVNIGTNRWSFKPGLGISKAIGKFKLELSTDVTFYTNNGDFFGGNTLEQDPIYSV